MPLKGSHARCKVCKHKFVIGLAFGACPPGPSVMPCDSIMVAIGLWRTGNPSNVVFCHQCTTELWRESREHALKNGRIDLTMREDDGEVTTNA